MIQRQTKSVKPNRRKRNGSRQHAPANDALASAIATIDRLRTASPKAKAMLGLLKEWLSDRSGYDETVWPQLRDALEQERDRQGARRLFDG